MDKEKMSILKFGLAALFYAARLCGHRLADKSGDSFTVPVSPAQGFKDAEDFMSEAKKNGTLQFVAPKED